MTAEEKELIFYFKSGYQHISSCLRRIKYLQIKLAEIDSRLVRYRSPSGYEKVIGGIVTARYENYDARMVSLISQKLPIEEKIKNLRKEIESSQIHKIFMKLPDKYRCVIETVYGYKKATLEEEAKRLDYSRVQLIRLLDREILRASLQENKDDTHFMKKSVKVIA